MVPGPKGRLGSRVECGDGAEDERQHDECGAQGLEGLLEFGIEFGTFGFHVVCNGWSGEGGGGRG